MQKKAKKNQELFSSGQIKQLKSIFEEYTAKVVAKKLKENSSMTTSKRTKKELEIFTKREMQIMKLICEEYTSNEIGTKLKLSTRTVEGYRNQIIIKAKARNVIGLIKFAVKNKICIIK